MKTVFNQPRLGTRASDSEGNYWDLCHLQRASHNLAIQKGWYDSRDLSDPNVHITMLALIATEVHEAIEEVRDGGRLVYTDPETGKPEGVGIELADVILRVCDYAEACGLRLPTLIRMKHEYNVRREHRHGGKLA